MSDFYVTFVSTQEKADMVRDDGHFFRAIDTNCWSPEARLADMNRLGSLAFYS